MVPLANGFVAVKNRNSRSQVCVYVCLCLCLCLCVTLFFRSQKAQEDLNGCWSSESSWFATASGFREDAADNKKVATELSDKLGVCARACVHACSRACRPAFGFYSSAIVCVCVCLLSSTTVHRAVRAPPENRQGVLQAPQ